MDQSIDDRQIFDIFVNWGEFQKLKEIAKQNLESDEPQKNHPKKLKRAVSRQAVWLHHMNPENNEWPKDHNPSDNGELKLNQNE